MKPKTVLSWLLLSRNRSNTLPVLFSIKKNICFDFGKIFNFADSDPFLFPRHFPRHHHRLFRWNPIRCQDEQRRQEHHQRQRLRGRQQQHPAFAQTQLCYERNRCQSYKNQNTMKLQKN